MLERTSLVEFRVNITEKANNCGAIPSETLRDLIGKIHVSNLEALSSPEDEMSFP